MDYPDSLDAERFRVMVKSRIHHLLGNRCIECLTATGGWSKLWAHLGGRGVLTTDEPRKDLDIPFVCMVEKSVYVRNFREILDWLAEKHRDDLVHVDFCALTYPYDELWFV